MLKNISIVGKLYNNPSASRSRANSIGHHQGEMARGDECPEEIKANKSANDKVSGKTSRLDPRFSEEERTRDWDESRDGRRGRMKGRDCSGTHVSKFVVRLSESFFYWYGKLLARYPLWSISICLIIPSLCAIGLLRYRTENNPYKLWVPQNSDYIKNQEWLLQNFPEDLRFHSVILSGENVLQPIYMKQLVRIHQAVDSTRSGEGKQWQDVCYKLPSINSRELELLIGDFQDYNYDYYEEPTDYATDNSVEGSGLAIEANQSDSNLFSEPEDIPTEGNGTLSLSDIHSLPTPGNDSQSLARLKRFAESDTDPSIELYPEDYCGIISAYTTYKCFENSLLEMWAGDNYRNRTVDTVNSLTQQDIINAVNTIKLSAVFDREASFHSYLGGVQKNSSGHIVGAKAMFIRFFGQVNKTAISYNGEAALSKGAPVDSFTLSWEKALIETLEKLSEEAKSENINFVYNVARSFSDLSAEAISGDAFFFAVGTGTVFVYVQVMLGKFNCVEQRPGLSAVGIACYGLALLTSYGFCSGVGLVFSPLHSIIPFLLMGVGIDDMFVIIQCLDNLQMKAETKDLGTVELMGLTMRKAGMAITLTSLTNFIVFIIGAYTALPALQSFCLYCAVGIVSVYIYQATIFSACLSLDIRRIKQKRNGCFALIKHPNWVRRELWTERMGKKLTIFLTRSILHPAVTAGIVIITLAVLGVGIWGLTLLKQEFNPIKFIPQESYLSGWFAANSEYFPKEGERVRVNIADIDYTSELPKLDQLMQKLENQTDILSSVDSWYTGLRSYAVGNKLVHESDWLQMFQLNETRFYEILTQFLYSPDGSKYRRSFNFVNDLICGKAAPKVLLSSIELTHTLFDSPKEWIPAMNRIKKIVSEANFSSRAFPTGTEYASWETDEVIGFELYQNIGLSLLCVLVCTFILIASLRGCFLIFICVLITLIDVGGLMHFWGLTIDVISCVNLVIAVGLCVDYAAHVVHAFLLQTGTRSERTVAALQDIGPAVINGGFSTFLAFVFTAGSTSHVFISFFKIFLLVVLFGLFHALLFLPVLLRLVGPDSHHQETSPAEDQSLTTAKSSTNSNSEEYEVEIVKQTDTANTPGSHIQGTTNKAFDLQDSPSASLESVDS